MIPSKKLQEISKELHDIADNLTAVKAVRENILLSIRLSKMFRQYMSLIDEFLLTGPEPISEDFLK